MVEPNTSISPSEQDAIVLSNTLNNNGAEATQGIQVPTSIPSSPKNKLPEAYKRLLRTNVLATILVVAIPGGWLLISFFDKELNLGFHLPIPFLLFIGMFGTLGAFFSALTRLSPSGNLNADSLFTYSDEIISFDNFTFWIYALLRPMTGFISAIILYLIFMSGLIGGEIFPTFVCDLPDSKCDSLQSIFNLGPDLAEDYIKALIWGFIAGFSERFLPNILENLEKSSDAARTE